MSSLGQGRASRTDPSYVVRPPAGHDGIGNALRAVYDDRQTGAALPEDFVWLLDQLR